MINGLDATESSLWRKLGDGLRESAYSLAEVRRLLALREPADAIVGNVARYSFLHLADLASIATPCAVLARLFLFGGTVHEQELALLPSDLPAALRRHGLVAADDCDRRRVHGRVSITEYDGRFFLSDSMFSNRGRDFTLHDGSSLCMPPHTSSLELLRALRPPAVTTPSFLDIGCGSGCQSILGGTRSHTNVRGFDINPRCVMFARVNAGLNGSTASYSVGDWRSFPSHDMMGYVYALTELIAVPAAWYVTSRCGPGLTQT